MLINCDGFHSRESNKRPDHERTRQEAFPLFIREQQGVPMPQTQEST